VAEIVVAALQRGVELAHYNLRAYVVMPNHVHVLLYPRVAPTKLLRSLKGATAREAAEIPEGRHCPRSQPPSRPDRRKFLAAGILRSLGARRRRVRPHRGLH
jgi:REP element-mobilizing transposase RayT